MQSSLFWSIIAGAWVGFAFSPGLAYGVEGAKDMSLLQYALDIQEKQTPLEGQRAAVNSSQSTEPGTIVEPTKKETMFTPDRWLRAMWLDFRSIIRECSIHASTPPDTDGSVLEASSRSIRSERAGFELFFQEGAPRNYLLVSIIAFTLLFFIIFSDLVAYQLGHYVKPRANLSAEGDRSDGWKYIRGLKYVFLSSVGFSLASVVVKLDKRHDGTGFPVVLIALLRAVLGLIFTIVALYACKLPLVPQHPVSSIMVALARGVFDFTATCLFYTACASLPTALATTVYFTNVFWAGLIARVFLGEPYELRSFGIICVGSIGVLVALWPELVNVDAGVSVSGLLCAVFGSVFQASQYVAGRALSGRGIHLLHQSLAYSVVGICLAPIALCIFSELGLQSDVAAFVNPLAWDAVEWLATIGVVACALVSQIWLVSGMEDVPASTISLMRGLDIPLAMIWTASLLHVLPNRHQVIGAGVVAVACSLLAKPV